MIQGPPIESAESKQRYQIGRHTAILLGDIVPAGRIEYRYIMAVFDADTQEPFFFVASEGNRMVKRFGGGSHFLCTWEDEGHFNHGDSDDWADESKFVTEALRLAKAKCGVQE